MLDRNPYEFIKYVEKNCTVKSFSNAGNKVPGFPMNISFPNTRVELVSNVKTPDNTFQLGKIEHIQLPHKECILNLYGVTIVSSGTYYEDEAKFSTEIICDHFSIEEMPDSLVRFEQFYNEYE